MKKYKNNPVPCLQPIESCYGQGCYLAPRCLAVRCAREKWKRKFQNGRQLGREETKLYWQLKRYCCGGNIKLMREMRFRFEAQLFRKQVRSFDASSSDIRSAFKWWDSA